MSSSTASKIVSRVGSLLPGGVQVLLALKGFGLVCGGKSSKYTWSCIRGCNPYVAWGWTKTQSPGEYSSVFVYVCGSPAVACFCRVADGCVNGGDVILSKVTCDSEN